MKSTFARWIRSSAGMALLLGVSLGIAEGASSRPNILFIMSDDHAAHALSAYGSKINQTPQLDRIAKDGMLFKNCFVVNSICTPSRATILTGKYSHLNGVPVFNPFDGSQPHMGKIFQEAGYQTAMIGKWHLFSDPTGFDYWNILPGQGKYYNPDMIEMGEKKVINGYVTDIITDLTIDFLKKRDQNKPFLLFSHHKAPHREWAPGPNHRDLYEDIDIPEPATFNDDYQGRSRAAAEAEMRIERDFRKTDLKQDPPPGLSGQALKKWNYQRYIKDYLRCVASIDDNVGRLLDYLEASGLKENTLVVYTSDQGFFLGEHGWYDKRFMYEESLRMPLLVSFPGKIKPGSVNDRMVLNLDFAQTLLDFAGVPAPEAMQGRSFAPMLQGESPADWRTSMYYRYYHYPADHRVQPHYGVRTERHKLIYFNKLDEWELFDLENDPREMKNLYPDPAHAPLVQTLKTELARLKKEFKDDDQFADGPPRAPAAQLRSTPLQLVVHYTFDQLEGGEVLDISGKDHHGRVQGGELSDGQLGRALKLERGSVVLATPSRAGGSPLGLNPAGKPLLVGAWVKPESPNGVVASLGGGSHGFSLYLKDDYPHFAIRSEGQLFVAKGAGKIAAGEWAHLAGELRANGELRVLVNGQTTGEVRGGGIGSRPVEGFTIGDDPGSRVGDYDSAPWRGLVDDLRLYWGELPADQVQKWAERP
jgi:arylsulfatase A-like enzyme